MHRRAIWKRYQDHPEGPYSYDWWGSTVVRCCCCGGPRDTGIIRREWLPRNARLLSA